ncbi:subtilisin-like protein [Tothia fuscella]|uniref:Subtilisin-like protein n=1 Tax=Tothia fuscella TaxID=1048955 RepID=A0A9P4TTK8_9PEZI|nr:subtilisin-like protein [Tothia fuscella]
MRAQNEFDLYNPRGKDSKVRLQVQIYLNSFSMNKGSCKSLFVLAIFASTTIGLAFSPRINSQPAPYLLEDNGLLVPDTYMVKLHDEHTLAAHFEYSGVKISHPEFKGKAVNFQGKKDDEKSPYADGTMADSTGHGTHVAGIINQVAEVATIVNVKVTGKGSTEETLVEAINDVILEHKQNRDTKKQKWSGAAGAGIPIATTAGNEGEVAPQAPCIYETHVVCVASCGDKYKFSSSSNHGSKVQGIANGENIWSYGRDPSKNKGWERKSGTSLAAAQVAGIFATFIGWEKFNNDGDEAKVRQLYA